MHYQYADRMSGLKASEIREILKVTDQPEIISFAGGLPAPELFPVEEMMEVSLRVLSEDGRAALQYASTEGYAPLRAWIAQRLNDTRGTSFHADDILLTNGSQQGLDLSGKVFLNEGDAVLCESPTYLSAISAFRAYGCHFREVPTDDEGMLPQELERILQTTRRVKLIYMIPNFQNPTGRTWSLARRKQLARIADQYEITVIEDDPYGDLRFEGEYLPSVKSFDRTGCVFYLGTFSKILCPGFRIGWVAGNREAINQYVLAKQGADLQSGTITQRFIYKYLELYDIDKHIEVIRNAYKKRRDVMVQTMQNLFPQEISFTCPQGGLFSWAELPSNMDARDILKSCIQRRIAFVPGGSFFPNGGHENTMRINFSNMPESKIIQGLTCLVGILKENMA